MFARRVLSRSSQRFGLARVPRRWNNTEAGSKFTGVQDNAFNRERAKIQEHAAESGEFWRKMTIFVAVPCLIVFGINAKIRWDAHWEHQAHLPPKEDRPEYSYQNIRTKNFFWGDGDKTLFWNDKYNYHKRDE